MKKAITFESAALAMVKSSLIEYLEIKAFNPDCIDTRCSIFRKKLKLLFSKSKVSPTKRGTVEPEKAKVTVGGACVAFPTPGRKNYYKDVTLTVEAVIIPVSECELIKEFDGDNGLLDELLLRNLLKNVRGAIAAVESRITAVCRIEIVKFGNVWSPVSVTADIDGESAWFDFLSGYETCESSLPRNAKIDESKPQFAPDFRDLLSL